MEGCVEALIHAWQHGMQISSPLSTPHPTMSKYRDTIPESSS